MIISINLKVKTYNYLIILYVEKFTLLLRVNFQVNFFIAGSKSISVNRLTVAVLFLLTCIKHCGAPEVEGNAKYNKSFFTPPFIKLGLY